MSEMQPGHGFPKDENSWRGRATFWMSAFMSNVKRNMALGFEAGPELDLAREMMRSYLVLGLENGDFRPDNLGRLNPEEVFPGVPAEVAIQMMENMEGNIPMSIVIEICSAIDLDAVAILNEYVQSTTRNLSYAATLLRPYAPDEAPDFSVLQSFEPWSHTVGVPMVDLSQDTKDRILSEAFPNSYILHVLHDDRPCRHPYDSLDQAIEAGAMDELSGVITAATHIEHRGKTVMEHDDLRQRIDTIKAAGMN